MERDYRLALNKYKALKREIANISRSNIDTTLCIEISSEKAVKSSFNLRDLNKALLTNK